MEKLERTGVATIRRCDHWRGLDSLETTIQFSELDLLDRYLADHQAGTFLDVGAHIGGFSRRFAEQGWQVHAFEPDPDNYRELEENLSVFDDAYAVRKAVSNVTGDKITFYRSTEYWGIHSLAPVTETHTDAIEVPVTRLDDYLRSVGVDHVDALKVDTEGADKLALEGFDFASDRPSVVMAEHMDSRSVPHFGYSHHDLVAAMTDHGYSCFVADWAPVVEHSRREGGGGPFTFLSCAPYPLVHEPAWGNLIFVPEQDRERFGEVLHAYLISLNAGIQSALRENLGLVDGLSRKVEAQAERIGELDAAIAQRDSRRDELDGAVGGRDSRIGELESAIRQRDGRLDRLEDAIAGRDSRIAELEGAVDGRDQRIAELDAAIVGRDSRIAELDSAIAGRDERAAKLQSSIAQRNDRVEELEREADDRSSALRRTEAALEQALQDWDATKAEAVSLRTELNAARRNVAILGVISALLAIATLALVLS